MSEPEIEVTDNTAASRYEARSGDQLVGWVDYRPAGASVILAHTEVVEERSGTGLGGALVQAALDRIAERGKTVIPTCPFAAAYVQRHPELVDRINPSLRAQFR